LALQQRKVDVWNSHASAGGASLAEAVAALDVLAWPNVNLIHVAIARQPEGVARLVPEGDASIMFVHTCDRTIGGGNHWIALGGGEVDTCMGHPSSPAQHTGQRAVRRQDMRAAICRAPGKHDRTEQCNRKQNELPAGEAGIAPPRLS
jgi:hypothetical protein